MFYIHCFAVKLFSWWKEKAFECRVTSHLCIALGGLLIIFACNAIWNLLVCVDRPFNCWAWSGLFIMFWPLLSLFIYFILNYIFYSKGKPFDWRKVFKAEGLWMIHILISQCKMLVKLMCSITVIIALLKISLAFVICEISPVLLLSTLVKEAVTIFINCCSDMTCILSHTYSVIWAEI